MKCFIHFVNEEITERAAMDRIARGFQEPLGGSMPNNLS